MMQLTEVLANLKQQRDQLDTAIHALESLNGSQRSKGRPTTKSGFAKRTMSPAARRRIAAAQRLRWARFRAQRRKAA